MEDANVRVNLKEESVSHWPFAPTENRSVFTPDCVTIESPSGDVVEELLHPRQSFEGYEMSTPWSNAQVAYFAGYTMWTYLTSPFILRHDGVTHQEIEPWSEAGEQWRRLRVAFPETIATHSKIQTFYFDSQGLLKRHDYEVDIQGSNPAARYLLDSIEVQGIILPGRMRIYPRNQDNTPAREPLIVSINLSGFHLE